MAIIDRFAGRYPNIGTAESYRRTLRQLFAKSGRRHPADLTEADLISFCTCGDPANNTVYQRRSWVRTFLRWCVKEGIIDTNPADFLTGVDGPLRTYRRTYGKVQAQNPGRWLTYDQAYGRLVAVCQDGTPIGLRNEIIVRLGLLGLRLAEIQALDVANLRQLPTVTWTGKGRKPRQATAGPALVAALDLYLSAYPDVGPASPLVCRQLPGATRHGGSSRLDWGHRAGKRTIWGTITRRAQEAGLGHVAPHDLRRTAAGILHNATSGDGAHHFDLLDIQRVLGHSDPATTMRSYLEPMDTAVRDRAAHFLD